MIQILLDSIVNYIKNENDSSAKKEFAESLHQLIDYRFAALIKNYKEDQINQLIELIQSFNDAPEPPSSEEDMTEWAEKYSEWYLNQKHKIYALILTIKDNHTINNMNDEKESREE